MSNPQVAIDITANDKSAKGIGSAEKHLKGLGSHTAKLGRDMGKIGERSGMRGLARTIGEVDSAMSGAFGTRSAFGGIGSRARSVIGAASALRNGLGRTSPSLGRMAASSEEAASGIGAVAKIGATAVAELGSVEAAGAVAATGLGEAAVAAGGLVAALGPIGVIGGAAVVTLGAAAAAGYKFASGWAAGTAQMGRFAETIGVASRDLQQLQGAAERYGVSKDATSGSLASFATISHDALYARNPEARALLTRLGVGFKKGADGNLDYDAMLSGVADAIQRQKDPQTRLMIANKLGLAPMLPALEKGGANLRSEKASFAHDGVVASDKDVANAQDFMRNSVILQQIGNKVDPVGDEAKAKALAPAIGARRHPALLDLDDARELLGVVDSLPGQPAAKLASRFLALTAVRLAAVRGAEWGEFEEVDWTGRFVGPLRPTWRVPAARMKLAKAKKADSAHDHLVPLSGEAVEVLRAARNGSGIISADLDRVGRYVFPGAGGRPLGEGAIRDLYARTHFQGRHVPHGWRATFSTLLNERFPADRVLIDRALAHAGRDKVEAAYNRAEHLARRRSLFAEWGRMIGGPVT